MEKVAGRPPGIGRRGRFLRLLLLACLWSPPLPLLAGELILPSVGAEAELAPYPEIALWTGPDWWVRVRVMRDAGDQTGPQDTWPKEALLILVLPVDGSAKRFYSTDKAFGWGFRRWVTAAEALPPSGEEAGKARVPVVFEVIRRDINRSDPSQLWEEKAFLVRVEDDRVLISDETAR